MDAIVILLCMCHLVLFLGHDEWKADFCTQSLIGVGLGCGPQVSKPRKRHYCLVQSGVDITEMLR